MEEEREEGMSNLKFCHFLVLLSQDLLTVFLGIQFHLVSQLLPGRQEMTNSCYNFSLAGLHVVDNICGQYSTANSCVISLTFPKCTGELSSLFQVLALHNSEVGTDDIHQHPCRCSSIYLYNFSLSPLLGHLYTLPSLLYTLLLSLSLLTQNTTLLFVAQL